MRQQFIDWLRQTPSKVVNDFSSITKCPLARFGQSRGLEDVTAGSVFIQHGPVFRREVIEVLRHDERQILCHADQNHQTYGQVADILEART